MPVFLLLRHNNGAKRKMRTRKQLQEAHAEVEKRLEALELAVGDAAYTPEQQTAFDQIKLDKEEIARELAEVEQAATNAQAQAEARRALREEGKSLQFSGSAPNISTPRRTGAQGVNDDTSLDELTERSNRALKAWMQPDEANTQARDDAKALGFTIGSREIRLCLPQKRNGRSLSMGVSQITTGGAVVAPSFVSAIEEAELAFGGIRPYANVMRTETSAEIPYPTVNDTGNTASIVAELATPDRTSVTMGRVIIRAHKYATGLVPVSRELLRDAATDVGALVGRLLFTRIFRGNAAHLISGIGTSQPLGIVTGSTLGVTAASASAFTLAELLSLTESIDPAYQRNAALVMNRNTRKAIRGLTSGVGEYLWGKDIATGAPQTFNGFPVIIDENMADIATGTKPIVFGDISKYLIRDVQSVRIQRFTELLGESDADGFTAFMESDGNLLDAGTKPIKHLVMA